MEGGGHSHFGVFGSGFLVDADDLSGARGVQGANLVSGFEPLAADDQIVFMAQLTGDQLQRGLHPAGVFRELEINKRLIRKAALGRARLN